MPASPLGSRWLSRLALDRPESRAWAMYDWANSAFMTTVVTAVFPIYFLALAKDLGKDLAQQRYAMATTAALVVSAIIAPILGSMADFRAWKKRLLAIFVLLGALSTAALFRAYPTPAPQFWSGEDLATGSRTHMSVSPGLDLTSICP